MQLLTITYLRKQQNNTFNYWPTYGRISEEKYAQQKALRASGAAYLRNSSEEDSCSSKLPARRELHRRICILVQSIGKGALSATLDNPTFIQLACMRLMRNYFWIKRFQIFVRLFSIRLGVECRIPLGYSEHGVRSKKEILDAISEPSIRILDEEVDSCCCENSSNFFLEMELCWNAGCIFVIHDTRCATIEGFSKELLMMEIQV